MEAIELARLVAETRRLQIAYFKRRDAGVLEQSKAAEKLLDKAVAEILNPTLFGSESP